MKVRGDQMQPHKWPQVLTFFLGFADSKLAADMKVEPAELPMDMYLPADMQSPVDIFPAVIIGVSLSTPAGIDDIGSK